MSDLMSVWMSVLKTSLIKGLMISVCAMLVACASQPDMDFKYEEDSADLRDDDQDGVVNARDICPDTQLGSKVSHDGCVFWEQVDEVQDAVVFFDTGSSELRLEHEKDIKAVIAYALKHDDSYILIEGHTSNTGSKEVNDRLQSERSSAVKELLIQDGANPARIKLHVQGEQSARIDHEEHGDAAHAVNQRVLIRAVRAQKSIQKKWNIYSSEQQ
jgi:outer membrane protein OmpA-like peptidoglycan-associated protein